MAFNQDSHKKSSRAMTLGKDQLRKIYGIEEPEVPADPVVLARRSIHESVARWQLKWNGALHAISFSVAFVVVLLPIFSNSWHEVIKNNYIAGWVFVEFSSLGDWLVFMLAIGVLCYLYPASKVDGKNYSRHGYPINLIGVGSWREVVDADLYPITKEEERVYWVDAIGGIWISTVGWFVMFGAVGFFIRLGGH